MRIRPKPIQLTDRMKKKYPPARGRGRKSDLLREVCVSDMARAARISPDYMHKILIGKRDTVSVEVLIRLSKVWDVEVMEAQRLLKQFGVRGRRRRARARDKQIEIAEREFGQVRLKGKRKENQKSS